MTEDKAIKNNIYPNDARKLTQILNKNVVDVTITSPPYFDLKDYGHKKQIGFGQTYEQYLNDLTIVFKNIYNCTKDEGTLWVIIDSFRRNNEVVPLPFDFSNKVKNIGWKLQEVIVWAKDRTVPWAHHGQMRNLFEYILLFSKQDKYNFFIDEVRDTQNLKKWWVKYPERYNPKGKTPDGLWHFDIPTQGSWGSGYIKHFCPLPEEMIEQILKIATKEGDLVLDPFAGSGAVLAKADNMLRNYIGFELNESYIKMFQEYVEKTGVAKRKRYIQEKKNALSHNNFFNLITDLRALKFAKVILSKLPHDLKILIKNIYVEKLDIAPTRRNAISNVRYTFFTYPNLNKKNILIILQEFANKAPLSKYGIQPEFIIEKNLKDFLNHLKNQTKLFTYTKTVTHKYKDCISSDRVKEINQDDKIISKIKIDLNEKDYE